MSARLRSTLDVCISSVQTSSQDIPLLISDATSNGTSINVLAGCPTEQCMGKFSVTLTTRQSYIGKNVYSSTTSNYNMISFRFQTR